ncbi:MAG: efflux RND transporter periplasmic adaptor subunit [Magnetospirillum sp.]|nr:efflux RND transporter periplasmic adaptor subunit [Magnetospirillum sp.]
MGGILLAVGAIAAAGAGIVARGHSESRLAAWTAEQAIPTVALIKPAPLAAAGTLTLPATLQPLNSAPIQARTTGYLREWLVDIGDTVRQGQVLVRLEAPELEQQLAAAQADLQTAKANERLAATTATRWNTLLDKGVVSKQAADEKQADLAAKSAMANAAQANVGRLRTLAGFTRLTAPFDGVVTSRSAEIGTLVSAGTASALPLFTIADISRIRASVRIPQLYSARVLPGMEVNLSLPEFPGRSFDGTVTRSAGAVDPVSGTVLVEVQADNADRLLKPGAYVQASFPLSGNEDFVTLPPSALIMGAGGPRVADVDGEGKARLRPVTLGRDRGKVVEVVAGLTVKDEIIDNPPDSLQSGDQVRVARR